MKHKLSYKHRQEIRYLYRQYKNWSNKYSYAKLAKLYNTTVQVIYRVVNNGYSKRYKCIGCKRWLYKRSFTTRQLKTPAPLCRTCYKRQFVRAYRYTYVWNSCYICGSIFRKHKGSKQFLCKNPECSDKYFNKGIRI